MPLTIRIAYTDALCCAGLISQTRELDLKPKFPEWDPELHYMVAVLSYLKSIFFIKDFPQTGGSIANPAALELYVLKAAYLELGAHMLLLCRRSLEAHGLVHSCVYQVPPERR